jgi:hypothetical protein
VWSGIASALAKAEIPAVVANQYSVLDWAPLASAEVSTRRQLDLGED